ncbi:MAG: DUF2892 domain-containing protein [Baekduia sp.]
MTMNENNRWPLERVLFALAGTMLLIATLLSAFVTSWFLLLVAFVALNQLLYAAVGACGASLILTKAFGLVPAVKR